MAKPIEIKGVESLQRELKDFSKSFKMKVAKESLEPAGRIVKQQAINNAPKRTGLLKQKIVAKVDRRGKSVMVKIGVLDTSTTDSHNRPVALYGSVQNAHSNWLTNALHQTEGQSIQKITSESQKRIDIFHSRYTDRGKK